MPCRLFREALKVYVHFICDQLSEKIDMSSYHVHNPTDSRLADTYLPNAAPVSPARVYASSPIALPLSAGRSALKARESSFLRVLPTWGIQFVDALSSLGPFVWTFDNESKRTTSLVFRHSIGRRLIEHQADRTDRRCLDHLRPDRAKHATGQLTRGFGVSRAQRTTRPKRAIRVLTGPAHKPTKATPKLAVAAGSVG